MSNIKYQAEIDGLRAIAILAVIVFHANESWLPGGFVGVDVFFVISGYLISRILIKNDSMQSKTFLAKRVKRILPAYLLMLLVTLLAGALLMSTEGLYQLSKKTAAALFQVTNITSLNKDPYFATSSLEEPLLHTWSLAVEWQFYLLVAVFLYLYHKGLKARWCVTSFAGLGVISFCVSVFFALTKDFESHAYYSFLSRLWEFSLGIAVALLCHKGVQRYAALSAYVGFVLLAVSLYLVGNGRPFPGYWALLPVLGTAAIIYGSQAPSAVKTVLSARPIVFVGGLSYSLYLWHWPVFAFVRYITNQDELSLLAIGLCLPVIIVLSLLSYYWVEKRVSEQAVYRNVKVVALFIFAVCLVLVSTRGLGKFSQDSVQTSSYKVQCGSDSVQGCGDVQSDVKVLLIGDSHAGHFGAAFKSISEKNGWHLTHQYVASCVPLLGDKPEFEVKQRRRESCQFMRETLKAAPEKYDKIFMASRWDAYLEQDSFAETLAETLGDLSGKGAQVYLLTQIPSYEYNGLRLASLNKRYGWGLSIQPVLSSRYEQANQLLWGVVKAQPRVKLLSANAALCPEGLCSPFMQGEFAYIDDNHVHVRGSEQLVPALQAALNDD